MLSAYYGFVVGSIREQFDDVGFKFDHICALGIGSLSSHTSQLQLAICLCLCDTLLSNGTSCSIFDPMITAVDLEVYRSLHLMVITENTKGKQRIADEGTTLFFMPHCPYRLYCNVIWANWENLQRVYIFGNR